MSDYRMCWTCMENEEKPTGRRRCAVALPYWLERFLREQGIDIQAVRRQYHKNDDGRRCGAYIAQFDEGMPKDEGLYDD